MLIFIFQILINEKNNRTFARCVIERKLFVYLLHLKCSLLNSITLLQSFDCVLILSRYESELALNGGEDGLDVVQQIIKVATTCLKPKGSVIL